MKPARARRRVDSNHRQVANTLSAAGALLQTLAPVGEGCPDMLVGYRAQLYLLEVKDGTKPRSQCALTPDEAAWHRVWGSYQVHVVKSAEEALRVVGALR